MSRQARQAGDRRALNLRLAELTDPIARKAFGKRGFATSEILTGWRDIAGDELARLSLPEKLSFPRGKGDGGTLLVRVDGAAALELQHLEPVLIGRINRLCGFRAVARLRLVQGPLPQADAPPPAAPAPLSREAAAELEALLAATGDPELRAALEKLGRGVLARQAGQKRGR